MEEREREGAGPASRGAEGMGDSGGSVVSVDVERISFGGKVSPPSFASRFCETRAAIWLLGLGLGLGARARARGDGLPDDFCAGMNLFDFVASLLPSCSS